jgi:hypothetical protein
MLGIDIDLKADVRSLKRKLTAIERRQAPFAIALGLTRTAKDIQGNTIKRMRRIFDRPTRFTLNAFRVVPARKNKHIALVGWRLFGGSSSGSGSESYLGPQEVGGSRRPKRFEIRLRRAGVMRQDEFAVPARGVRLNRFGNIPGSRIVQILSQLQALSGPGSDGNETVRSRKRAGKSRVRYFAVTSKANRQTALPPGVYERRANGKVRGVLMFVRRPVYRAVLGFYDGANKTARARLPINMRRAFEKAIKTAR